MKLSLEELKEEIISELVELKKEELSKISGGRDAQERELDVDQVTVLVIALQIA